MPEKMMDKLRENAVKATWNQFEKLDKDGNLFLEAAQELDMLRYWQQTDPEFSLTANSYKDFMFYDFDDDVSTPYCRLRVNRYLENGQRVMMVGGKDPCNFNWTLEKDLAYLEFADELGKCAKIEVDNTWHANCKVARRIAKDPRFKALDNSGLTMCLKEILNCRKALKHLDAACGFCFRLLGGQEQYLLRADGEGFLNRMNAMLKLPGGITELEELVQVVDGLAKEFNALEFARHSRWHAKMERRIKDYFKAERERVSMSISRANYIRMKLKLAVEIGIVGEDKNTGRYVEIHQDT